ncbi:MAG TPA: ELWxxDGT repeat protein [Myxococcales bacterium]|nr:ELWxxDGT repeat protein [Myxococcales bacterium]
MASRGVLALAASAWLSSFACTPEPEPGPSLGSREQGLTGGLAYELRDINPDGGSSLIFFNPHPVGNLVVFNADDGAHGYEPWVTDGTPAGTRMLADLNTGASSSVDVLYGEVLGGRLYFRADGTDNGSNVGFELYETDGTPGGTFLTRDLALGTVSSNPLEFAPYTDPGGQQMLLFSASGNAVVSDTEPWGLSIQPDGGILIARVADVDPGTFASFPTSFTSLNRVAYFLALNPTSTVYSTTGAGATPRLTLPGYLYYLEAAGGRLYFREVGRSNQYENLWSFEPDSGVAEVIADAGQNGTFTPHPQPLANGSLLFDRDDGVHGMELWATDGTAAGTSLVKDIYPGPAASTPQVVGVLGGVGYLVAGTDAGASLWRSDGTPAGTSLVRRLDGAFLRAGLALTPENLLLVGTQGVWVSDGTTAGTRVLPGVPVAYGMARAGPRVFFSGGGADGVEPWALYVEDLTDVTAPSLTCPASVVVQTDIPVAVVNLPAATASDAVSTPAVTYSPPSGSVFQLGTTSVTVTAVDRAGNSATCRFSVTVRAATDGGQDAGAGDGGGGGGPGGCGCSSAGGTAGVVLLALLAAAVRWTPRRRRGSR